MTRKYASAAIQFGMAQIPFGIAKASDADAPDLKSLCECGERLTYARNDDGHFVVCKSDECDQSYSHWNAAPGKGYEVGDETIPLTADEVEQARENVPVEIGQVEKAAEVGDVLLHYAVEGNYYLLPEDEFEGQYGALVAALNELEVALLTYLELRSKTQRFAIVSRGGVLLALLLRDKKPLPDLEYGADDALEANAKNMIENVTESDPTLPEVEGHGIKELIREKVNAEGDDEPDAKKVAQEV